MPVRAVDDHDQVLNSWTWEGHWSPIVGQTASCIQILPAGIHEDLGLTIFNGCPHYWPYVVHAISCGISSCDLLCIWGSWIRPWTFNMHCSHSCQRLTSCPGHFNVNRKASLIKWTQMMKLDETCVPKAYQTRHKNMSVAQILCRWHGIYWNNQEQTRVSRSVPGCPASHMSLHFRPSM